MIMNNQDSVHVVIAHYNENTSWINNIKYKYTLITKNGFPLETIPNKGNEASGYLQYIISNYETLSEYTIFVHGHQNSWHCKENMDEKINKLVFDKNYYNINDNVNTEKLVYSWCKNTHSFIPETIHNISLVLKSNIDINNIIYKQCAQFYVKKDNILRHSKETYIHLRNYLMTTTIPSWLTSRGFEYTWHYIFTGEQHDKS